MGKGDIVAELRDVWGRPAGNGVIRSDYEGIVLGRSHGVFFYAGQPILTMAVRDDDGEYFSIPKPAIIFDNSSISSICNYDYRL